ncbi:hypothetical protein [Ferrovibrio sp.]|uniref:hypothetical protein n=1 Tax=Ferrovibrio sp. TaxID=1917215 RepID=UPI0035164D68
MQHGVSAAVAAMEQAVRRLDAALAKRGAAFRSLSEQHGMMAVELKTLRDALEAARAEAASLRERADLVDALRAELAQMQQDAEGPGQAASGHDAEVAELTGGLHALRDQLTALGEGAPGMAPAVTPAVTVADPGLQAALAAREAEIVALKAELAAAQAAQAEMQAFQAGLAARLEATMARLRQALDAETAAAGQVRAR